ncbi:MAG: hypothetical protein WD767_17275 [Alphaproteobacteria bacterium]
MIRGILAVWSDITPEAAAEYDRWYEEEHMFERLVVDGFHGARHYCTVSGQQMFFTYFITDNAAVMQSPGYFHSTDNTSAWSRRIQPHFRNTNRTAYNVIRRIGWGYGAAAMTIRMEPANGCEDALVRWLGQDQFPALLKRPGIIGLQIWKADMEATRRKVLDEKTRGQDRTSGLTVFIEATGMAALEELENGPLSVENIVAHGAVSPVISRHQLMNFGEKAFLSDI